MGRLVQRVDRTLEGLRALPGVEAAATAGALPGVPNHFPGSFTIDGHDDSGLPIVAESRTVSSGYFDAVRIALLQGQACRTGSSTTDFLVNRSFAERFFHGQPALGHGLAFAGGGYTPPGTIRGIVGDARENGLNIEPGPTVYACFNSPTAAPWYLVRTRGDAMAMAGAVRQRVHALEPARSVYGLMPLDAHLDTAFAEGRLRTLLLAGFAATALALACVGLYGTLNYLGRVRERETGLRLTLGASRLQVGMRFLLQGLRVTVLGCVVGALLSVLGSRALATMLYGVSAVDAGTYSAVLLFVLAVATIACALPARRAAQVEPVKALRAS